LTGVPGRSPDSLSAGTDASKVQFPNEFVEVSLLEFPGSTSVPPIVCQLLWSTQMFLTELSEAFGSAPISETNRIQPAIRAFFQVLVEALELDGNLKVLCPGEGVKMEVKFRSDQSVRGIPDLVVSSAAKAPPNHWRGLNESVSVKKKFKALLVGEMKLHSADVVEALQSQVLWYLYSTSECLGSPHEDKGRHFGMSRFAVATDGFSWGFLRSEGVPHQDGAKWCIGRIDVSRDTDQVARALVSMLTELHGNAPQSAAGDTEGDSESGSSGLNSAEQPSWVDNQRPGHGDMGQNDDLPPEGAPAGGGFHRVHGQELQRLSDTSGAATRCKTFPVLRGDGIPRGLDAKVFAEMTSAERVELLFVAAHR
jgi:hypothetical protein